MLTRRAKLIAVPVRILSVYLQPFCRSSFLDCAQQLKIAKKTLKPLSLGVHGRSNSSMLIRLKSSSLGLVVIGSISMPICNCFHGRLANNSQITTLRGYRSMMLSCAGFHEPRRSRLGPLKSTFIAENFISYAACLDPSVVNSAQLVL